jgi:hypothetical protein
MQIKMSTRFNDYTRRSFDREVEKTISEKQRAKHSYKVAPTGLEISGYTPGDNAEASGIGVKSLLTHVDLVGNHGNLDEKKISII